MIEWTPVGCANHAEIIHEVYYFTVVGMRSSPLTTPWVDRYILGQRAVRWETSMADRNFPTCHQSVPNSAWCLAFPPSCWVDF